MRTPEQLWKCLRDGVQSEYAKAFPSLAETRDAEVRSLAALVAEEVASARAEEREACARIAEAWLDALATLPETSPGVVGEIAARIYRIGAKTATEVAAAIRARRAPPTETGTGKEQGA